MGRGSRKQKKSQLEEEGLRGGGWEGGTKRLREVVSKKLRGR